MGRRLQRFLPRRTRSKPRPPSPQPLVEESDCILRRGIFAGDVRPAAGNLTALPPCVRQVAASLSELAQIRDASQQSQAIVGLAARPRKSKRASPCRQVVGRFAPMSCKLPP